MTRRRDRVDGAISYSLLRQQITMERVLNHLGHLPRLSGSGPQRRGPCPVHQPTDPFQRTFCVNLQKNVFHCFSPRCGASGTCIDLWAAIHRLPLPDAARHMATTFGVE